VKNKLVLRCFGFSVLHWLCTAAAILVSSYFQLARGQHGGAPYTFVEGVANAAGFVFMFPLAVLLRLAVPKEDLMIIASTVVNSGLCGFLLARARSRRLAE
jgi:hypothetical protein